MKKKISIILLFILSSFLLINCGNNTSKNDNGNSNTSSTDNNSKVEVENSDDTLKFEENKNQSGTNTATTEKTLRLFYYDGVEDKILYEDTSVNVTDGALVTAIINELKVNKGEQFCTLDSNISVKSAKLEKDKDLLTVNFGENFVNNMNLGSSSESGVLQAIVNSLGYNFNVKKIYITVNGNEYASGHIMLDKGEAFTVDYSTSSKM